MDNLDHHMRNLHIVNYNPRRHQNFLIETFSQNFIDFNDQHPNPIGVFIEGCPDEIHAFEMLTLIQFNLKFIQLKSAFMIVVEIDRWMNTLTAQDISRLLTILPKKKPFLISFESLENEEVYTFWTCGDAKSFSIVYSKRISNFMIDFLSLSIQIFNPVNSLLHCDQSREIYEVTLMDFTDFNNQNLLMMAAGRGDADVVEILLQEGFDVNYSTLGHFAVDLAWNNGHQNIVLMLLIANSRIPKNFNLIQASPELRNFVGLIENLHTSIILNDYHNVVTLLDENVNLQYYYGTDNISALARAMMNDNVQITNLLLSRNVAVGPHERYFVDTEGFFRVQRIDY